LPSACLLVWWSPGSAVPDWVQSPFTIRLGQASQQTATIPQVATHQSAYRRPHLCRQLLPDWRRLSYRWVSFSGYPLVFSIWTDANEKPDVMLESWTISPPTITPANLTLSSVVSPLLLSGTPYWALYTATSDSFSPPSIFWGEFSSAQPGGIWGGTSIDSMTHDSADLPAPALHIDGAFLSRLR